MNGCAVGCDGRSDVRDGEREEIWLERKTWALNRYLWCVVGILTKN